MPRTDATRANLLPASPLGDPTLPANPTLYYVRASSRKLRPSDFNRGLQSDSPETQVAQCDAFGEQRAYGKPHRVFVERESGRSFAKRGVYHELRDYCERNTRADAATI